MIAVDWGTTHVRAWLLGDDGRILERRSQPAGVMAVDGSAFARVLEQLLGPWAAGTKAPVVMCGMVGSRQGWIEVPYLRCPAKLDDIAGGVRELHWLGHRVVVCPGLACDDDEGVPDVLRGEETQALGAMVALPAGVSALCLPGTHSKHLRVRDGSIEAFTTHMTGELFAILGRHSILGRLMAGDSIEAAAFDDGVRRSGERGGLLHHVFGARSRALQGEMEGASVAGYLSGMLIGHEVRSAGIAGPVRVIAPRAVGELYVRAFSSLGCEASLDDSDVAAAGLYGIAGRLGVRLAA